MLNFDIVHRIYHSKFYKRDMEGHCSVSKAEERREERQKLIIKFASKAPVTVYFLADKLNTTTETIRHDVSQLISLKLLKDVKTNRKTQLIIAVKDK